MANSNTLYRRWTRDAINCYNRGCVCKGCILNDIMQGRCRMKQSVIELVRLIGIPPKHKVSILPGVTEREEDIIEAIFNGAKTVNEIAEGLELSNGHINHCFLSICRILELQGWKFKDYHNKYQEAIDYIATLKPREEI